MVARAAYGRLRLWRTAVLVAFAAALGASVGWCQETAVAVGEKAPAFTLAGSDGQSHSLSTLIGHKRLVLIFYRGVW
jgi:cytochrome oxidase Cu insertion factor (SCO1/SenC/PrrC family)